MKKCLAVITARGGSKRIPRKNIKDFCGKPIIQYSIDAALNCGIFDEVMVSTEDEEIRKIAEQSGAKVPFLRSQENANDVAMTHTVLLEVLNDYKKIGMEFEYVCCIYPTAPFITEERLKESRKKLEQTDADGVVPVVAYSFPPQRSFLIRKDKVEFQWPQYRTVRSQDLEKWYHDCGQFYFVRTSRFIESKNLIMENTVPIILDEMEVQDIDSIEDWEIAELKYHKLSRR